MTREARTQAVPMAHFADRREIGVKFPMRATSVDPKSTQLQAVLVAHFVGWRESGVKLPMRAASVDPKSTQLTPQTTIFFVFHVSDLKPTLFD